MIDFIYKLYKEIQNIKQENLKEEYFTLLEKHNIDILNFLFYKAHNITFDDDKSRESKQRIYQDKFKKDLINLYGNKCILSKTSIYEACHIIPFCISNYTDKYNKYNGLLLKADLHILFDKYIFSINPETLKVEFDKEFLNNENNFNEYKKYDGVKINLVNNKTLINNIYDHYNTFLTKNIN